MIQKTQAFKSSDGQVHPTLREAQERELMLLAYDFLKDESDNSAWDTRDVANFCIELAPKVIDILTTTATSIPAARAINGNKRPRKKKHIAEQFPLTGVEPTAANP